MAKDPSLRKRLVVIDIMIPTTVLFAMLGGWLLLAERLSAYSLIGAGLLLAAMLVSVFTVPAKNSTQ